MNNKSVIDQVILFVVIPLFIAFTIMMFASVIYTSSTGKTFDYGVVKALLIFLAIIAGSIILHYVASMYLDIYLRLRIFSKALFPLFAGAFGMYLAVKIELIRLGSASPAIIKENLSFTSALIFGFILLIPTFLVCLMIDWGGKDIWDLGKEEAE